MWNWTQAPRDSTYKVPDEWLTHRFMFRFACETHDEAVSRGWVTREILNNDYYIYTDGNTYLSNCGRESCPLCIVEWLVEDNKSSKPNTG